MIFGHIWPSLKFWPRYSLTFWTKIGHFSSLKFWLEKYWFFQTMIFTFWQKLTQGYSLTFFWPKIGHFSSLKFWLEKYWFFQTMIFGQKPKAIALLFGQKLTIFLHSNFGLKNTGFFKLRFLGKNPSLTIWPKIGHFSSLKFWLEKYWFYQTMIFGQKPKAIALLFGQKLAIFLHSNFGLKNTGFFKQ